MDVPCIDNWTKLALFSAAIVFAAGTSVAAYWAKLWVARHYPETRRKKPRPGASHKPNGLDLDPPPPIKGWPHR